MMNWFKKKTTDWMILHALRGTWKISNSNNSNTYDDHCNFEISYSESEDKVKIEMSGYQPKGHKLYEFAMKILGMYNEAILINRSFEEVKKEVDDAVKKIDKK